jgi:death-on-curing protein
MRYLVPEQVLFLHSRLIEETGCAHGVRDLAMLLSALGRPRATFDGKELYPGVFPKAAALMDSLIRNPPFVDGNKRTGITAAGLFLRINGYALRVQDDEMVRFTLACAQAQVALEDIALWLQQFSFPDFAV